MCKTPPGELYEAAQVTGLFMLREHLHGEPPALVRKGTQSTQEQAACLAGGDKIGKWDQKVEPFPSAGLNDAGDIEMGQATMHIYHSSPAPWAILVNVPNAEPNFPLGGEQIFPNSEFTPTVSL